MLFDQFNIFEIKYMAGKDAKWRMHLFVVKKKRHMFPSFPNVIESLW